VKLFVTHGGLNSTLEGLSAGLPLVVLPYFGDQPLNAQHVVNKGLGTKVGGAGGRGSDAQGLLAGRRGPAGAPPMGQRGGAPL
jgi:hypothetical protein